MVRYNKKDRTNFADDDDEDGTLEEGKKELFIMWSFMEKKYVPLSKMVEL